MIYLVRNVDARVLQKLDKVFVDGLGLYFFQFQNGREFVDEIVERVGRRDDEHVARPQFLVVVHEITEAVQHDHRLAASGAALQNKVVALGLGDDIVLFFLNCLDDIGYFRRSSTQSP